MPKTRFQYYLFNNKTKAFFEIRDGSVCGRMEGDLQFKEDDAISRRQCRFTITGNEIYIEDFESTNKTRVNSVPIQPNKKRRIRLNDQVEIGAQRFVLTHQKDHNPAHLQDEDPVLYKAMRNEKGSLTGLVTGFITQRTMVLINKPQHRILQIQKTLKPVRNHSKGLVLAFFAIVVLAAAGYLYLR